MRPTDRRAVGSFLGLLTTAVLALTMLTPTAASAQPLEPVAASAASVTTEVASAVVPTAAVTGFNPGNIISDANFFDSDSMSESQIQSFLNARVPTCASGYVCLKSYVDQTRAIGADAMCNAYSGGGRETAARIISKVARACGISPKVILVTLQKEQGLVTHTAPSAYRYRAAMGQGCPDTAACDTRYYGLFNQIYGAAWQFKRYANPPGTSQYFTWYAPGRTWNVLYNPNRGCGSSPVYIQNQATANLYYYTPYQPNSAALAAGYGIGDGCSSYGNRNFYNYYTQWFGSTQAKPGASPIGYINSWTVTAQGVRVSGWAIDPDTANPISVRVKSANTTLARITADKYRRDLGVRYPDAGARHAFDVEIPLGPGAQKVCVVANNVSGGSNRTLGCSTITPPGGSPYGVIDSWEQTSTGVRVTGWAIDPDTVNATTVRVKSGNTQLVRGTASVPRDDVARKYVAFGGAHGFALDVPLAPGEQKVCLVANNIGKGSHRTLGCATITPAGGDPFGAVDSWERTPSGVRVSGWAIDPDTTGSTTVRVKSGNTLVAQARAATVRDDLASKYVAFGGAHGFSVDVPLQPGTHSLCTMANNIGAGSHRSLGCTTVVITDDPFGTVVWTVTGRTVRATGWVTDPNTSSAVGLRVKAGETLLTRATANGARPGQPGDGFGFDVTVQAPAGASSVCIAANNVGPGANRTLGCTSVG